MSEIKPPPEIGTAHPRAVDKLIRPFKRFTEVEGAGGIILLICTAAALFWANVIGAESYEHFWHTPITVQLGDFVMTNSLVHWIDDGLMAIFFFLVGLEIKREVLVGELASIKKSALPLMAALGGMIFPALIYTLFNGTEGEAARGWGIPMATDIAFALGVLALLGKRIPPSLVVFLAALAIADDIGAVLVIAIFYTSKLSLAYLLIGLGAFVVAVIANVMGARNPITYGIIGAITWLAFLKSGVHATIAGVLVAMAVPAKQRINLRRFIDFGQYLLDRLKRVKNIETSAFSTHEQMEIMQTLENSVEHVMTPLQRYEHGLQNWVAYLIMPVFALANAGVAVGGRLLEDITSPIGLGIICGLVLGKQIGITFFSWISVKLGFAALPSGVKWKHIYGVAWLGGIGFTMSLFVANLAFGGSPLGEESKIGILTASIIAGTIGFIILKRMTAPGKGESVEGEESQPATGSA
ncbi:MAG: Na+/H+ antiporter NhaA [Ignavibacteriae bacterium]|nr:Na+/H+ antiporter NhaA [Ignavibacteriota bacterium]MCB9215028.1 Na+/H+ antiporter NhaA [Ignavibacteria bacterium]